ncbi:putative membrane protein [Shimia isoporae]|uniref:Putative membrane protein n=1 Tax=Shimia isoporae TaxID=647720 RepID=A0A4R1NAF9_9RHOB|nr:DUF2269 family protein [Shimia isoporae]TCL00376.1 putative membrane protein [Shimia isoporae]
MIDTYFIAKFLHLLAMTLMLGGTVINGLLHTQARRAAPVAASQLLVAVMRINRLLMLPALLALPLSGVWLIHLTGSQVSDLWILAGLIFSGLLLLAYALGLRIETTLLNTALAARATSAETLPKLYASQFRSAAPIGFSALAVSLAALTVMILKPL